MGLCKLGKVAGATKLTVATESNFHSPTTLQSRLARDVTVDQSDDLDGLHYLHNQGPLVAAVC